MIPGGAQLDCFRGVAFKCVPLFYKNDRVAEMEDAMKSDW